MNRRPYHLLTILLLLLGATEAKPQSSTANYVKTETFTSENGTSSLVTIDYLDKKGRLSQRVSNGIGNGNFLRTCYEYDAAGRLYKVSLPFDSQSDIMYKEDIDLQAESEKTYQGDKFGYTEYKYDALGNVVSALGPGYDWFDDYRDVASEHLTNWDKEVKKYDVSPQDGSLVSNGYYAKGELSCVVTSDEDWKSTRVYSDQLGRKVLERKANGENHDTYFVYDQLGRLRFVLTPQFQKEQDIQLFAYRYTYDGRGRMVSKAFPGCEKTEYWYDSADRLVLMQNARLRSQGRYCFYMYDALNRLCIQGNCTKATGMELRNDVKYQSRGSGIAGSEYTSSGNISLQGAVIEEARYYDSYDFLQGTLFGQTVAAGKLQAMPTIGNGCTSIQLPIEKVHTKGLLTGKQQYTSSGEVLSKGTTDFKDGNLTGVDYSYDTMGAMEADANKGVSMIEYDLHDFPHAFQMRNGHKLEYDYTPDGHKLKVVRSLVTPEPFSSYPLEGQNLDVASVSSSETTEYLGNFILKDGKLDKVLFMGGYASLEDSNTIQYHYFTQDQQGNVRAVFDDEGKVEQCLTYDAFGNIIPELSHHVGFQPYAFNGKELERSFGLNLHDFGFRMYDSVLGRWTSWIARARTISLPHHTHSV